MRHTPGNERWFDNRDPVGGKRRAGRVTDGARAADASADRHAAPYAHATTVANRCAVTHPDPKPDR